MTTGKQLAGLLLLSTGLTVPGVVFAQGTTGDAGVGIPGTASVGQVPQDEDVATQPDGRAGSPDDATSADGSEAQVSIPGGEIVVTGRVRRDPQRNATQVLSVLSAEQIARTGEGDIAGALGRVTGLSVQGNGLVFVRGLGDRYSLALLNGLPLPSPEPLSRVVPLDIFPTSVVASSLVQKTYSANFPGEFGGGVINLTTSAVPDRTFVTVGGGISGDTETTGQVGYSYFGADSDWTGFDDGTRDTPQALQAFFDSGEQLQAITDRSQVRDIIKDITNPQMMTIQRLNRLPVNFSGTVTAGTGVDVGDGRLGIIATAGISNRWRNRVIQSDASGSGDLALNRSSQNYTTDNRVLVNGLLGLGLEIGEHRFRFTNLFIRDTIKQTVLGFGTNFDSGNMEIDNDTSWFERQLFDTQFVGEMEFGDLEVDVRTGYAQTQREAPFEYSIQYFMSPGDSNPYQGLWQNTLDGQRSSAFVSFSDLTEDNYHGGLDLSYPVLDGVTVTAGYAYTKTERTSSRREFRVRANGAFPAAFSLLQPAGLLSDDVIDFGESAENNDPAMRYQLLLDETTSATPAFNADLEVHAGYVMARGTVFDQLTFDVGVRYEDAQQTVQPDLSVYTNPPPDVGASTALNNNYFLPAATLTYEIDTGLQARLSASKTIARPQFRELIFQPYQDPETTRTFRGNPLLTDSELLNLEGRLEYYPGGGTRALLAGFYKKIDRPIEAFATFEDGRVSTSFANAPSAELYGGEAEFEYRYDLDSIGDFFTTKQLLLVANYTYTQSSIKVEEGDTTAVFGFTTDDATLFFRPDVPLTGQSDHLVNLQLGLEDTEQLQQLTFLLSYASDRVVSRGFSDLPDIMERPGARFDIVFRQGINLGGVDAELKLEARNLFRQRHQEFQETAERRIEINTYDIGTSFGASLGFTF